jgi:endo-1,4-beta-xylanase
VIDAFAQMDESETTAAVVDTTPPELSISVAPTTLWPPNHKLVPITVTVATSDICDTSPTIRLLSITSNESPNGNGDGNTSSDVAGASFGQDDRQFMLRAERSGNGSGRVYTITYEAADDSGNATVRQTSVSVAKSQGG